MGGTRGAWGERGGGREDGDSLTRRVRESGHRCARATMEKGSQCVGMKECSSDTVAMPPIVDASSAVHRSPPSPPPPSITWQAQSAPRHRRRDETLLSPRAPRGRDGGGGEICEASQGDGEDQEEEEGGGESRVSWSAKRMKAARPQLLSHGRAGRIQPSPV